MTADARGERRGAPPPPWPREIVGGGVASIATVAIVLTLGLLSCSPLGDHAASIGIAAAFVSVTLGGLVFALFGSSAIPVGGPSSATALIFAALVATLVADPAVALSDPAALVAVVSTASLAVMLMGAMQIALAALGLGRLAGFVPQPVLAGFMNGVAVLIVISQLPALFGVSVVHAGGSLVLADAEPLAFAVGLATAIATWLVGWRWRRSPAALIGLAIGLALYAALRVASPGSNIGQVVGPIPHALPSADLAARLLAPPVAAFALRHAAEIVTSALVLALISSLESVLGALAIDQQLNARHHPGRELMALGLSNVVSGFFGGLPMVLVRSRALATLKAGGRGPRAALAGAVVYAVMYAVGGPALALMPKAVLAGIMLTIAVALVDRWTHQLVDQVRAGERSRDAWRTLAIVATVCAITVWKGFVPGVAAGILASLVVFIRSMNRSLVRSRCTALARPSRRLHPASHERILRDVRDRIVVLELEGALFFGSADRLADEADGLDPACRFLVLDFRRVSTIDESGAVLLQQLSRRLHGRRIGLLLAGVTPANAHGRLLRAFGSFREAPRDDWFPDADRAVEAAEQRLLAEAGTPPEGDPVPLETCSLFRGVAAPDVAYVRERMQRQRLAAGEQLFRQGDPADRLYVLTHGSLTIVAGDGPAGGGGQRFASYSPGVMLGETAMLDRGGRSAGATADAEAEVFVLTEQSLGAIVAERPALGAQLFRNIAVHLSERLRSATSQGRD